MLQGSRPEQPESGKKLHPQSPSSKRQPSPAPAAGVCLRSPVSRQRGTLHTLIARQTLTLPSKHQAPAQPHLHCRDSLTNVGVPSNILP